MTDGKYSTQWRPIAYVSTAAVYAISCISNVENELKGGPVIQLHVRTMAVQRTPPYSNGINPSQDTYTVPMYPFTRWEFTDNARKPSKEGRRGRSTRTLDKSV